MANNNPTNKPAASPTPSPTPPATKPEETAAPVVVPAFSEADKTADTAPGDTSMTASPPPAEEETSTAKSKDADKPVITERETALITAAIVATTDARRRAPAATPGMDQALRPGGMFVVGGQVVNANGEVIEDAPKEVLALAKQARANRTDVQFADEE